MKQILNEDAKLIKNFAQLIYRDISQYLEKHREEFAAWEKQQGEADVQFEKYDG